MYSGYMDSEYATTSKHLKPGICALYLRVSTVKQETKMQRDELLAEAKKLKLKIYDEYEDIISGSKPTREGLERLKRDAIAGRFGTVLIWKLDRLSRMLKDGLNMFEELEDKYGLQVNFLKESHLNTGTPGYKMARNFVLIGAEMELGAITTRVRSAKHAFLRAGKWATWNPPHGYSLQDDKSLKINEKNAKVVRKIFNWYVIKNNSARKIAEMLNEQSIPSPKGKKWMKSTILKIVSNRIYTGYHLAGRKLNQQHEKYKDIPILDKVEQRFPQIIPKPVFERAQELKYIKFTNSPKNLKRDYLFRGLIKCHKCGHNLFGRVRNRNGKEYIFYQGTSDESNRTRCKPRCGMVSEIKIINALLVTFTKTLMDMDNKTIEENFFDSRENLKEAKESIKHAEEQISKLKERHGRVMESYYAKDIDVTKKNVEVELIDKKISFYKDKIAEHSQASFTDEEWEYSKRRFLALVEGLRSKLKFEKVRMETKPMSNKQIEEALQDLKKQGVKFTESEEKVFRKRTRSSHPTTPNVKRGDDYYVNLMFSNRSPHLVEDAKKAFIKSLAEQYGLIGKIYVDFANQKLSVHPAMPGGPEFNSNLRTRDIY